ncbi:hypothetical protein MP228_006680 [Amoeboaphelidium protococcarum]|nr:hypothetical protein MP228_006680 [Amoeboaphelidium protococcarum]
MKDKKFDSVDALNQADLSDWILCYELIRCSNCQMDIPGFQTAESRLCRQCYTCDRAGNDMSASRHSYPPLNFNLNCVPANVISIPKKALVAIMTRISSPGSKSVPDITAVEECVVELSKSHRQWTQTGRPLIPGLGSRELVNVGHYHGNGMLESSMEIKTSGCSRKPYIFLPADVSAHSPSKGDILIIGMTHPHNFGSANPYYIAEILEFLQCSQTGQHQIPLKDVYLVCVGFENVGGVVQNDCLVVNAADIMNVLLLGSSTGI